MQFCAKLNPISTSECNIIGPNNHQSLSTAVVKSLQALELSLTTIPVHLLAPSFAQCFDDLFRIQRKRQEYGALSPTLLRRREDLVKRVVDFREDGKYSLDATAFEDPKG